MSNILRPEDVPTRRTTLQVSVARFNSGRRSVELGNVTTEEIETALEAHPKTFRIIIGGWPLSVERFRELVKTGELYW